MPPSVMMLDASYEDMQTLLNDASKEIESMTQDEINALSGKPMLLKWGALNYRLRQKILCNHFHCQCHFSCDYDLRYFTDGRCFLGKLDF